eukprot:CAMPEP_0202351748 /NCGR_PEP_ID=MMETSP1126-20121109/8249_1 /ASSEMBLY_ACC=CAM_ASM_000457 /TAXON_ID=3047 /ORGANISM="Dunaliella tertiolecta, Strain CCMP1320" /LENGTH=166 /DNA_ID=CAMNT_0048943887 /DNA_START=52 /DNA_END=552 /DNA_ORIENTATION=+
MALRNMSSKFASSLGLRAQVSQLTQQQFGGASLLQSGARAFATVKDGLKYAASHEWAQVNGDVATVGVSDHAQGELGDVVYVELPEVGKELTKGDAFGVVESVKAASDVYAPVSGEVVETNQSLTDKPAAINSDPYGAWIMKIKMSNPSELDSLMDPKTYEEKCAH